MFYGLECWVVSNITEQKVIIAEGDNAKADMWIKFIRQSRNSTNHRKIN